MSEYKTEIIDFVNNSMYTYYKLYVNDKCYFDEFYEEVMNSVNEKKDMDAIVALMDDLGAQMLPSSKFNYIHDPKRNDLYEFKKKKLLYAEKFTDWIAENENVEIINLKE